MPFPRRSALVLSVVLLPSSLTLVASCGAQPVPPNGEAPAARVHQGIMGGTDDTGDPNVVGIAIVNGWSAGLCTGSLIAPNLVLTARHCVSTTPEAIDCSTAKFGSPYGASSFYITTGWNAPEIFFQTYQMQGTWYEADKVVVPPDNSVCGNDVALIRLQGAGIPGSAAEPLIPRVDKVLVPQEEYRAVGFGATNDSGAGSGRRRQLGALKVNCVDKCLALLVDHETEWEGDRGVCQGDSGGPALDLKNRVVGVVSRGGQNCTSPVYGSVFGWADWIKQNAIEAAQAGGYQPAPWVTGAPTGDDIGTGGTGGSGGTGGEAGAGGSGATGGAAGGPGTGGPGEYCAVPGDCQSGLCVFENTITTYCSATCSADNPTCPGNMQCATSVGACFLPGGFGAACQSGTDCRSGVCVGDTNGQYCSQYCDAAQPVCPDNAICSGDPAACFQPPRPAASSSSGGCSVAGPAMTDPTKPIPWAVGFGLLGLLALRRRPRP